MGIFLGVAVYIKDGILFVRRTDLRTDKLESIWLEIKFLKMKSSTSKYLSANFNKLLNTILLRASWKHKKMILTGDFNVNYLIDKENIELKSIFTNFQIKQIIKTATRTSNRSESLILQTYHSTSHKMTFLHLALVITI